VGKIISNAVCVVFVCPNISETLDWRCKGPERENSCSTKKYEKIKESNNKRGGAIDDGDWPES